MIYKNLSLLAKESAVDFDLEFNNKIDTNLQIY